MTIKELIEKLKEYDESLEVKFDGNFYSQGYRDKCKFEEFRYLNETAYLVIEILE